MADYKQMYLDLLRATEDAIQRLNEAQQKCEEMYMDAKETPLQVVPALKENRSRDQKPSV